MVGGSSRRRRIKIEIAVSDNIPPIPKEMVGGRGRGRRIKIDSAVSDNIPLILKDMDVRRGRGRGNIPSIDQGQVRAIPTQSGSSVVSEEC